MLLAAHRYIRVELHHRLVHVLGDELVRRALRDDDAVVGVEPSVGHVAHLQVRAEREGIILGEIGIRQRLSRMDLVALFDLERIVQIGLRREREMGVVVQLDEPIIGAELHKVVVDVVVGAIEQRCESTLFA